ncbi:hypothetical protein GLOTRDRAFT_118243 [Gloeophyllum trabeum ATCC 11539]|uniref:Protein-S-isoprenylcysteine O-methyltransferase n=1 Tax=Gloeophyllum trabeum (strain ATCC 11539 / FP-39264 / Madison 617) TaxID=670483 RepID=S7R9E3_GLOTA|nr:uncharacterized protein GLOTRDRAFT_118243 [Gloeophyllum trabeum ATCC 11539]EPQ50895.1 hypothetical protein GLOTRDRAFT_118243 [Gloeophyllum trabeum ATCC 11539]
MSLVRAPLTIIAAYGMGYALTPPNPPVSDEERAAYRTAETTLGRSALIWTAALKYLFWAEGLCEAATILAHNFPYPPLTDHVLLTLLPAAHSAASIRVTPSFLVGTLLTTVGAYWRRECFRTLGRFFTFELSIRKEHQLVTTGPYSIVRHPGYLGTLLAFTGIHACLFGPGSLLRESGILETRVGQVIIGGMVINMTSMVIAFARRPRIEDETLKQQFGEQWDRWAERVPYRIIPYIY